jgi:hypothetical protein
VINATAPVRMKVRRLAIGVLGIALDGGRETVDLAGPFSLDDMSHPSIMEEVVVTLPMLNRYYRDLRKTFAKNFKPPTVMAFYRSCLNNALLCICVMSVG